MDLLMALTPVAPLMCGWIMDLFLADPVWLPHPVVAFGRIISFFEHRLNAGSHRKLKGGILAITLIVGTYAFMALLIYALSSMVLVEKAVEAIAIFFCLAGTTLSKEVRMVFTACEHSLDAGRRQVSRIVGRDTSGLTLNEVRTAALETLAENLSDGVVAPLFWYMILGVPGMMAYKMVNTLDSMIGYRTERYRDFGCVAARIDDVANFIPARLTAVLMAIAAMSRRSWRFIVKYGRCHASPNSGYPEAALAGVLDCRFGGAHDYFGERVEKPYIGQSARQLTTYDMRRSIGVNRRAEILMLLIVIATKVLFQ